ncbi:hypothetical protein [Streptomyces sp. H27-S2]|uniref:hypothetical protein n=1 Tax=Streptomyces antarcticus TaxID=2996458 RepID=UPI00226E6571|nr:hypothetical protein [Streptomyces sp. H27-S2]MCY0954151.1 hypothetical protein [Streptomyces sp. H27-S2]
MSNSVTRSPRPPGSITRWRTRRAERIAHIRRTGQLTPLARWTLGVTGAAMAGAGAVAVFITATEAGPTALIIVGAVLLVAAVMGRQIKEISLADGTMTWVDTVGEELRNAPTAARAVEVASAATIISPEIQHNEEIRELSHAAYEQVITDRLRSAFGRGAVKSPTVREFGFDALVATRDKKIVIQTKFGDPNKSIEPRRVRDVLKGSLESPQADAIVLVATMLKPPASVLAQAREFAAARGQGFTYVRWTGDADTPALQQAVEEHLQS